VATGSVDAGRYPVVARTTAGVVIRRSAGFTFGRCQMPEDKYTPSQVLHDVHRNANPWNIPCYSDINVRLVERRAVSDFFKKLLLNSSKKKNLVVFTQPKTSDLDIGEQSILM
jgi:hypothetical protein